MRIIAARRDYYDSVQASDGDRSLVFLRDEVKSWLAKWPFPKFLESVWYAGSGWFEVRDSVIGFCGRIYPFLQISIAGQKQPIWHDCHFLKDVDVFMRKNLRRKLFEEYQRFSRPSHNSTEYRGYVRRNFERYFDVFAKQPDSLSGFFRLPVKDHSPSTGRTQSAPLPIFVAHHFDAENGKYPIIHNCILKPYEFFRVFDAYTAYQEISMFLGNASFPDRPIPALDDVTLAQSKGFNKYSFRRDPIEKRRS